MALIGPVGFEYGVQRIARREKGQHAGKKYRGADARVLVPVGETFFQDGRLHAGAKEEKLFGRAHVCKQQASVVRMDGGLYPRTGKATCKRCPGKIFR